MNVHIVFYCLDDDLLKMMNWSGYCVAIELECNFDCIFRLIITYFCWRVEYYIFLILFIMKNC